MYQVHHCGAGFIKGLSMVDHASAPCDATPAVGGAVMDDMDFRTEGRERPSAKHLAPQDGRILQ